MDEIERLDAESLRAVGIEDVEKGLRQIERLAGQGVTDDDLAPLLPILLHALANSPDPDRALNSFARWFDAVSSRYSHLQTLLRHPVALDLFCLVTGCSQYFADLMTRNPEYFEIIANPGVRGGAKSAATFYREASSLLDACQRPELKRDALRRWKAREMLRIGVRDLVGLAEMPSTAREFSNLADACVQAALDIVHAALPHQGDPTRLAVPFAVFGMGKLGGQELNYSSDIDLVFVHGDDLPEYVYLADGRRQETLTYLNRVAETLLKALADETAQGHVFRVDMRLRPEGRFGPLTRSLSSCRAYYESWAEHWERQAMLKARFIAGDRALGEAFSAMLEPFVYRRQNTDAFLEDIRHNKRRIEKQCELEGETFTNVKTGYGGIRDIEFLAQFRQLELGGRLPRLRTPNTLSALQRLHHAGLLSDAETAELAEDYRFLRNLEHRLQLLNGFQTQALPTDPSARAKIARRMGYAELDSFEADLQRRRDRVHGYLERLFYASNAPKEATPQNEAPARWRELNDLLDTMETPAAQRRLKELLTTNGFQDLPAALSALQLPMRGNQFGEMPPDTPVEFKGVAPRLMELLSRSPDPDAGLAGIEALATAVPNRAQLYASFDDSPEIMAKTVRLAAASPPLLKRLNRHLEWMETLFADEEEAEEEPRIERDLFPRLRVAKSFDAQLDALARYHQREFLRIGAQEIWEETDTLQTMAALTRLASETLEALLQVCGEPIIAAHADPEFARRALSRVAVLGLGKLGGAELGYSSDWDVVFGYDEERKRGAAARSGERFALANALAERVHTAVQTLSTRGANVEMDLRLRPWGGDGSLINALSGVAAYYRAAGETWERQAALKAALVAGNRVVGRRFVRLLHAVSFGKGLTAEQEAAILAMKRRIETERLKPAERETDLKLGYGGLTDIEWLAQRLQLKYGKARRTLRLPNTVQALSALASERLLDNAEADLLTASYLLQTKVRNALWLQTGAGQDAFPTEARRRLALARFLGYSANAEAFWDDLRTHRMETRRIFERRFLNA